MGQSVFNRYEKKYLLDDFRYRELLKKLQGLMKPGQYGQYTICNIYYDTADDELIRTSIEKPVYKEKLRLRSYGIPALEDKVYLEIKKKYQGIVNKRRISLPLSDAYTYLEQRNIPLPKEDPSESPVSKKKASQKQIMKELNYFISFYDLMPRLYLAYDRKELSGIEDEGFRLTFDTNIRSRREDIRLDMGDYGQKLLPADNLYLMESKVLGAAPLWFANLLSELEIYPISFSKYGNIYKKELLGYSPCLEQKIAQIQFADNNFSDEAAIINF